MTQTTGIMPKHVKGSFDAADRVKPDFSKLRLIALKDVAAELSKTTTTTAATSTTFAATTATATTTITTTTTATTNGVTATALLTAVAATGNAHVEFNALGVLTWVGGGTDVASLSESEGVAMYGIIESAIRAGGGVTQGLHDRYIRLCEKLAKPAACLVATRNLGMHPIIL
jgi:cytoskeletal protein RodZ